MNILVLTPSGNVVFRPDTSWERLNSDFYVPDFVQGLSFSPIVYARISRPGKAIGNDFVTRYYDALGFGLLLYPSNFCNLGQEGYASSLCLSHSSYLPVKMIDREDFSSGQFCIKKDSSTIYSSAAPSIEIIEKAICKVSEISLLRKGDLVAVELQAIQELCSTDNTTTISLSNNWFEDSEFQII